MSINIGDILNFLSNLWGTAIAVFLVISAYLITRKLYIRKEEGKENKKNTVFKQVSLGVIVLIGALIIFLTLPIDKEIKGQITGLVGIVLSAAFALSSTTFLGNAMAGITNRMVNSYDVGDIIIVKEYFGRVSTKGLFHTEIQAEDRNLITFPNIFLASNPVKVIRKSGTLVSTSVSLGYDVSRNKIENCLLEAAKNAGLSDAFVYIKSLGDFSVVYKIHGMLAESDKLLTSESKLNYMVLDHLHEAGIEIVSPAFMNQRQIKDTVFIPQKEKKKEETQPTVDPEELFFDKAIKAETIEKKQEQLAKLESYVNELNTKLKGLSDQKEIESIKQKIVKWTDMLTKTVEYVEQEKEKIKNDK